MKAFPTFAEEKILWDKGYDLVIGVDEVGRGCFAGPVVAGAVVFTVNEILKRVQDDKIKINDSKLLKPKERDIAAEWIRENCIYGIGEVDVETINTVGIGKATFMAMRQAIAAISHTKSFVLVDAFTIPDLENVSGQKGIIKGDQKSISIAAASIIAKVYRDSLMEKLSQKHPDYLWAKNKGYGTLDHRNAIIKNGSTPFHRTAFVNTFLASQV